MLGRFGRIRLSDPSSMIRRFADSVRQETERYWPDCISSSKRPPAIVETRISKAENATVLFDSTLSPCNTASGSTLCPHLRACYAFQLTTVIANAPRFAD